jgi:MinD superfamily P-loop ATPase
VLPVRYELNLYMCFACSLVCVNNFVYVAQNGHFKFITQQCNEIEIFYY